MKLVFPGGEHPQVILQPGVNSVGSAPDANIVLDRPGVQPRHCQLHVTANGVMLDVPSEAPVTVNGSPVRGLIALRDGDRVSFDRFEARLTGMENVAVGRAAGAAVSANDDLFATTVRAALPKFMLRGMSGHLFGRSFALGSVNTVGRAPESTLQIDENGISRAHARLVPSDDCVQIEDVGSTNGTFLNGKRILHGEARAGDEIGFDTLRFQLISTAPSEETEPQAEVGGRMDPRLMWGLVAGLVLLAGAIFLAL
ncbi:FHA domain-containing protein [Cognatilysobacter lacus]|uniref:FHA domain-containing protein n=1 Tax=Cognatilysobacter lacus TaxID=1643323 RepID=A0A5D8ZA51_9GAMM|nr:FHA domain-containing protein [Lysobacter lacus]TZF91815.1 FHA domain-containing protein [Lysobacter lacus]